MTPEPRSPPARYRVLLGLARAAVTWERLWPRLWPVAGVTGLFLSVALLDVLPRLPGWLHGLALAAFALALAAALRRAQRGFRAVDTATARHRLETDSGLAHRPLGALGDRLVGGAGDVRAAALWHAHLERAAEAARRLRVRLPAPGLARVDPHGLRAAVLLFIVVALAAGRGDAAGRLGRALMPDFGGAMGGPVALDVWITPPTYTGVAPLFLDRAAGGTVEVPAGSGLLAQVSGAASPPRLVIGDEVVAFTALGAGASGDGSHRVEAVIEAGDRLAVEYANRELASWPLRVVADEAPEVFFVKPPQRTGRALLRLDYEASDDYGLAGVTAVIRRPSADGGTAPVPEIRLPLPLTRMGTGSIRESSTHDLRAHPWAGLPVEVMLTATDGRGQTGESGVVVMALPERIFNHPVARAIIEQRKKLVDPTPLARAGVIRALDTIASRPALFFHDTVVYLALSVAGARLIHDHGDAGVASVQRLLWNTALRIEDGELSLAEQELRRIQQQLMRALEKGAQGEEIERLMDELQRALDKYMAQLREQLKRQGALEQMPEAALPFVESRDLQRMIEQARELARTGSVDAARRMLSRLQRMLDGIRAGVRPAEMREDALKARRMMDGLRALTQRQQQLLDRSFRQMRRSQGALPGRAGEGGRRPGGGRQGGKNQGRGQSGQGGTGADARAQEALRRALGEMMLGMDEFLGRIPDPLGTAERAMRDATRALGQGVPGGAVPAQTEALENLRRGAEGLAERIARRMGLIGGPGMPRLGGEPGPGRDPFGRRTGGAFGEAIDGAVKIPDRMEIRRAREILDELRRRAGERQRPLGEREYIERLLRQF